MLVDNTDDQATADPGLLRIVARAHDIQARLMQNTDLTVHVVTRQERVSANYNPLKINDLRRNSLVAKQGILSEEQGARLSQRGNPIATLAMLEATPTTNSLLAKVHP